jgi:hypothetical protein
MAEKTETNESVQETSEVSPEAEAKQEQKAEAKPSENLAAYEGNKMLLEMFSDPDVQAILAARREGKEIKVVPANDRVIPEAEAAQADELEDYDDDIKKLVELIDKKFDTRLDPVIAKVTQLEGLAQGMQKQAVDNQIKAVSDKHEDFDKYRKEMAELARGEGKNLSVQELYVLAKLRAGELNMTEPSTYSERPTTPPRRKGLPEKKDTASKRGRKGFQVTLADALENLDLSPRE